MHNDLHPAIRAYLLGLLELRLGNPAGAADALRMVEEPRTAHELAVELRARIAVAEGRRGDALLLLDSSQPRLWFQLTVASPFFTLASRRFLHAELLAESGRSREAIGWYRAIAERSPYELIYAAPAHQRLARIHAAQGDSELAGRHARKARLLWREGTAIA
jgi:tetratricopeptide (TPR) repeat protein